MPTDPADRALVERFMMHRCNNHCLDNDSVCKRKYPFAICETTHIDARGFAVYKRGGGDKRVVPYNLELLRLLNSRGIDIRDNAFSHGQQFVSFSRATSSDNVVVFTRGNDRTFVNVVLTDLLK